MLTATAETQPLVERCICGAQVVVLPAAGGYDVPCDAEPTSLLLADGSALAGYRFHACGERT